jgi:uncharacterized membrane protein YebE (DUF533 family)
VTPYFRILADTLTAALWADGKVEESERTYLRTKLGSLGISGADLEAAVAQAGTSKALADIEHDGLSEDERKHVFEEAFIMITSDRKGGTAERDFLKALIPHLGFTPEQGKALMLGAAKVAKERQRGG